MDKYEVINNTAALLVACKLNYEEIQIELVKMVTKIEGLKPLNEVDVKRSGLIDFSDWTMGLQNDSRRYVTHVEVDSFLKSINASELH